MNKFFDFVIQYIYRNKKMDINFILILILVVSSVIVILPIIILYAKDNKKNTIRLSNCGILHELEFGGVCLKITIDEFNKLGFEYGDSVNVFFSNGYTLRNIPYYNGYYSNTGSPLVIGYPGYRYLEVSINNGDDLWNLADLDMKNLVGEKNMLWEAFNLNENITATIVLEQRGKYLEIQKARDIHYYDDRNLFADDETFANFRSMKGGKLKENYFYRSASPCNNIHLRASYVDKLSAKANIKYVINLADTEEKIKKYMEGPDYNSPYFAKLYNKDDAQNDCVEPLALTMNYGSKYFKTQTLKGLNAIIEHDGPFLIHCTEGKDRTGFFCMLVEMLADASYKEIVDDYMLTYKNYYSITRESDKKKYDIIVENVLNPMIFSVIGKKNADLKKINFAEYARRFLLKNKMTEEQIKKLKAKIKM